MPGDVFNWVFSVRNKSRAKRPKETRQRVEEFAALTTCEKKGDLADTFGRHTNRRRRRDV